MNFRLSIATALWFITACQAAPPLKPEPQLITRQAEPMVSRIPRAAAERFEVSQELFDRVQASVRAEADSNEIQGVVGLRYTSGDVVLATHTHFPVSAMTDEAMDAAVDDAALDRCETLYPACMQGLEECDEAAFMSCRRTAYSDPFVHHYLQFGVLCAVVMLSRYSVKPNDLRLLERTTLEELACDFTSSLWEPAALDVDLDGGPEIALAYVVSDIELPTQPMREILTIVDAEDLHIQTRLVTEPPPIDDDARTLTNVTVGDRNGDGLPDLITQEIMMRGEYCADTGWTASGSLMRSSEPQSGACEMEIVESFTPYDPATDVWK